MVATRGGVQKKPRRLRPQLFPTDVRTTDGAAGWSRRAVESRSGAACAMTLQQRKVNMMERRTNSIDML